MKKTIPNQIIVSLLLLSFFATPVMAANSQGLSWAVAPGQRYDYAAENYLNISLPQDNFSRYEEWDWYLIVDDVPTLPSEVTTLGEIHNVVNRTSYFVNGSQPSFNFIWYSYPVGNWDIIVDFWKTTYGLDDTEIIDTDTLIGWNATSNIGGNLLVYNEVFLKSNGVLQYLYEYGNLGGEVENYLKFTLLTPDPGTFPVLLVVGAVGAVALIAIVVVLYKRR